MIKNDSATNESELEDILNSIITMLDYHYELLSIKRFI